MAKARRSIVDKHIEEMLNGFFCSRTAEDGVAVKTARENCTHVRHFYSSKQPVWEKENELFRDWILECPKPSDVRNQRIFSLRKFWDWAQGTEKRKSGLNFAKTYKTKRVNRIPKIPSRQEVQKVLGIMDGIVKKTLSEKDTSWAEVWKTMRNLGVIVLMACTGIRAKELLNLAPNNFDIKKMQIFIPSSVSKTRIERCCDIPNVKYAIQLIEKIKLMHKSLVEQNVFQENSPLFAGLGRGIMHENSGRAIGTQTIWSWARKVYQEHNIGINGVHDFRRYFATDYIVGCYENGKNPDIQKLSEMLGHTSLDTTQLYVDKVLTRIKRRDSKDYEPGKTALQLVENKDGKKVKEITLPDVSLSESMHF